MWSVQRLPPTVAMHEETVVLMSTKKAKALLGLDYDDHRLSGPVLTTEAAQLAVLNCIVYILFESFEQRCKQLVIVCMVLQFTQNICSLNLARLCLPRFVSQLWENLLRE